MNNEWRKCKIAHDFTSTQRSEYKNLQNKIKDLSKNFFLYVVRETPQKLYLKKVKKFL